MSTQTLDGWKTIDTAPTNGRRLMLWHAGREEPVFGRWRGADDKDITHWKLPPDGPTEPV